ncbi:MAG: N-methylhydantoinase A [Gammaproteobacteria bacterium]|jgi:N-methylhydantoinase A
MSNERANEPTKEPTWAAIVQQSFCTRTYRCEETRIRIGVDIGGTFTDLVGVDASGRFHVAKTPSTPSDPSQAVLDGLGLLATSAGRSLAALLDDTALFIHGTTVATNLLVERKGARLAMVSTKGFRDILELREGTKTNRYDLRSRFPQPLIPRPLRRVANERTAWDGAVQIALDEDELRQTLGELKDQDVQGVVVCFLHAHCNAAHELRARDLIAQIGWTPFVSLSHEVLAREGEYDRASTATVNAYVGPGLSAYLSQLQQHLSDSGLRAPMLVMQSSGGVLPANEAVRLAVGSINSGPAGGAMAAALYARLSDCAHAVSYDMGGTSTDICLIENGTPLERYKTEFEDVKISMPTLDITALGAGGGSLAWIDSGGILDLGPQSAGADPGPACYGRGGLVPTLTDANLVLGYICAETFLGGRLSLSLDRARTALHEHIAQPLGLSAQEAALAVNALGSSRIAEGIRAATVRRGLDPRDFSLLSFGGAGGVHAEAVARELSIPSAIVPREASVLSAIGFLAADVRRDFQRTIGQPFHELGAAGLRKVFADLEHEGRALLEAEGFTAESIRAVRTLDCRYARQVFTVSVPVQAASFERDDLTWLITDFEAAYRALYRHVHDAEQGVIDTCSLALYGVLPRLQLPQIERGTTSPATAQRGARRIFLADWVEAPVYWFDDMRHGMRIEGPAVVDSTSTSVLISHDGIAEVDAYGSLHIQPAAPAAATP